MTYDEIISAVKKSMQERDKRRAALARRIELVAEDALDASRASCVDCGQAGLIVTRSVKAACRQGPGWPTTWRRESRVVAVIDGSVRAITTLDLGYHDGHNMQRQVGPARDGETRAPIRAATVAQLRAIARALPDAVARVLLDAKRDAEAEAASAADAITELDEATQCRTAC